MRLAFIRAGLWFFGAIIAVILLSGVALKDIPSQDTLLTFLLVGALSGGLIFFITWYDAAKEEKKLEMQERRRKILHGE